MSGSPSKRASNWSICFFVSSIEADCGRVRSTRISTRSDEGKNCCCTNAMPTIEAPSKASVTAIVSQRARIAPSSRTRKIEITLPRLPLLLVRQASPAG